MMINYLDDADLDSNTIVATNSFMLYYQLGKYNFVCNQKVYTNYCLEFGGEITDASYGAISSPLYGQPEQLLSHVPNTLTPIVWHIYAPDNNYVIRFTFDDFNVAATYQRMGMVCYEGLKVYKLDIYIIRYSDL